MCRTAPGSENSRERRYLFAPEWARELLTERTTAPLLDDVLLLLSEVVTNAITHSDSGRTAGRRVTVRVIYASGDVHVEVTDREAATGTPAVRAPEPDEDGGRGLWPVNLPRPRGDHTTASPADRSGSSWPNVDRRTRKERGGGEPIE